MSKHEYPKIKQLLSLPRDVRPHIKEIHKNDSQCLYNMLMTHQQLIICDILAIPAKLDVLPLFR